VRFLSRASQLFCAAPSVRECRTRRKIGRMLGERMPPRLELLSSYFPAALWLQFWWVVCGWSWACSRRALRRPPFAAPWQSLTTFFSLKGDFCPLLTNPCPHPRDPSIASSVASVEARSLDEAEVLAPGICVQGCLAARASLERLMLRSQRSEKAGCKSGYRFAVYP